MLMKASPIQQSSKAWLKACALLLLIFASACSATMQQTPAVVPADRAASQSAAAQLGIQITALRISAEGYVVDLRYKALDPVKAEVLFSRKTKPYLMQESSGKVVTVPTPAKIGPLRQTTNKPEAGRGYFMLFGNPGQFIRSGDKVTLIFGGHRVEHLTVE